jgi:putative sterol carrier protein
VSFPSEPWAQALQAALNANAAYADAARAWEGDVLLKVLAPTPEGASPGVHLDLYHGTCRAATYYAETKDVRAEFVYQASKVNWDRLFRREMEPVQAILGGSIQLRGNLAKAARFTRAAKELVETAAKVDA